MVQQNLMELLNLPAQFGYLFLAIGLILLLAPYFSGQDFGIIKIPSIKPRSKTPLKIIGPVIFLAALALHVDFSAVKAFVHAKRDAADQDESISSSNSGVISLDVGVRVLAPWKSGNCLYPGTVIDSLSDALLVWFEFGEQEWIKLRNIYPFLQDNVLEPDLNADVYVKMDPDESWAPGRIKEFSGGKMLIALDPSAECVREKAYEWANAESVVLK